MTKQQLILLALELVEKCKNPYPNGISVKKSMERVLEIEKELKTELKQKEYEANTK